MKRNNYRYEQIISEKLGKNYARQVEYIKEEQCIYCKKYKKKECRLKIEKDKCVNYEKMDKRKC